MSLDPRISLPKDSQQHLVAYVNSIVEGQKSKAELRNKMEAIDLAYARYQALSGKKDCDKDDIFESDNVVAPIVASQVDTTVAYLADVFLSGTPLFPVVSTPSDRTEAEQLETLMDDHALLGGYHRQFLLFLKAAVKYNVGAIEASWEPIQQFSVLSSFTEASGKKIEKDTKYFNKVKALDMYNTFWDESVSPCDVPALGSYAGYIELVSKVSLKRDLDAYAAEGKVYNLRRALGSRYDSTNPASATTLGRFTVHPTVSSYVSAKLPIEMDWASYLTGTTLSEKAKWNLADGSIYEKITIYVRILPSDFGIPAPAANTPQIWKLIVINGKELVYADRIISAYDSLPILFGQPQEDFFQLQTQSIAEAAIPFQESATKLMNIRFSAARRAVSDRALYDAEAVDKEAVNSKAPAAKIPVRRSSLMKEGLDSVYRAIPFDMRGTETVINDAREVVTLSQELSGINGPQRGQFQKGNKSVAEWEDTMGGSNNRLRLQALLLEHQVFHPFKQIAALNIFQYGTNAELVSQKTGEIVKIDIEALRSKALSFRIADGYSPKSKIASTEVLVQGMTLLMNAPLLQQALGPMLPAMFAHMMQLGGVRGLEEYLPTAPQGEASPNLMDSLLQGSQAPMGIPQGGDAAAGGEMLNGGAMPPTMPS